jgi:Protein of unknown function (DUF4239)
MYSIYVSFLIFMIVFSGSVVGMYLRRALPDEHLSADARVVMNLSTGFVVTMTGLVLGMLVSSAKSSYDSQKLLVAQTSSQIIFLDRTLTEYGPETNVIRSRIREFVEAAVHRVWPSEAFTPVQLQPEDGVDVISNQIRALVPNDNSQSAAKNQAIAIIANLRQSVWLLFIQSDSTSLSTPLLVVLVSWLVAIFVSFGLFAPPNPTVIVTLLISALAVSSAILIIMEMYSPFSGILRISSAPMHDALNQIRQ